LQLDGKPSVSEQSGHTDRVANVSDSLFSQERERSREMLASTLLKYIPVAYNYTVEVPPQNPVDGVSCGLPISNPPQAHEAMRSKMSDIPEHIEQRRFPRRFHWKIESEIRQN
jgi:hypothetical protein